MSKYVTLATASYSPTAVIGKDPERRLVFAEELIEKAALSGAQILCFPETVAQEGLYTEEGALTSLAEEMDGFTLTRISAAARTHNLNIIWPLYLRRGERITNSAVLIERQGSIAGVYDKIHPVICEMDSGITPGSDLGVFDTEIGRIGLCICYDMNFPDVMNGLGKAGAQVVFFASAYIAGLQAQFWSMRNGYYLASAVLGDNAQIVDISGHLLAVSGMEILMVQRINLDRRYIHMDYNELKIKDILRRYKTRVHFDFFPKERRMTISSEDPDLSLDEVFKAFDLETQHDFFLRADRVWREKSGLPPASEEYVRTLEDSFRG